MKKLAQCLQAKHVLAQGSSWVVCRSTSMCLPPPQGPTPPWRRALSRCGQREDLGDSETSTGRKQLNAHCAHCAGGGGPGLICCGLKTLRRLRLIDSKAGVHSLPILATQNRKENSQQTGDSEGGDVRCAFFSGESPEFQDHGLARLRLHQRLLGSHVGVLSASVPKNTCSLASAFHFNVILKLHFKFFRCLEDGDSDSKRGGSDNRRRQSSWEAPRPRPPCSSPPSR